MSKVCAIPIRDVSFSIEKSGALLLVTSGSSIDKPAIFFECTFDLEEDETSDLIKRTLTHTVLIAAFSSFLLLLFLEEKRQTQKKLVVLFNKRFAAFLQIFRL